LVLGYELIPLGHNLTKYLQYSNKDRLF
jgi:hypothetical protein